MTPTSFVKELASISLDNVFNPYHDTCHIYDKADAARLRRTNLRTYLSSSLNRGVDTIWMGRDLGYRGGRRTGLALTDEAHLPDVGIVYPGCSPKKSTKGFVCAERTAAEIWSILKIIDKPPFLWNVFPFHPHELGQPFTNRRFTVKELAKVSELNDVLIRWLKIERIVAIGQDAAKYASSFGVEVITVRHPSYGGVREFRSGMRQIHNIVDFDLGINADKSTRFL